MDRKAELRTQTTRETLRDAVPTEALGSTVRDRSTGRADAVFPLALT